MRTAYLVADNIISPIGFSTEENLTRLRLHTTGIAEINNKALWHSPFFGAFIDKDVLEKACEILPHHTLYTTLEKMMVLSISKLLIANPSLDITKSGVVIATVKGNIDALRTHGQEVYLSSIATTIQQHFDLKETPIVLSNACISGGLAIAVGKRMIQLGRCDDVIVVGGDLLSEFTLSGFFSFQAVSSAPCKPFCENRSGISLGEAAASAWLSVRKESNKHAFVQISGDASANDANHISGPSRTGEGLYRSVQRALKEAKLSSDQIDHISAHGTATPYNDEMEAIAFNRVGLQHVPVNSLKGYYGHTLGASALIESIIARHCLINNELFASLGFDVLGVSKPLHVLKTNTTQEMNTVLKTASGFGGCNLALILEKVMP